jgi:hypothetical protein
VFSAMCLDDSILVTFYFLKPWYPEARTGTRTTDTTSAYSFESP